MLILTRRLNEVIRIGSDITIRVTNMRNGDVSLGIDAPREIAVHRQEIFEKISKETQQ